MSAALRAKIGEDIARVRDQITTAVILARVPPPRPAIRWEQEFAIDGPDEGILWALVTPRWPRHMRTWLRPMPEPKPRPVATIALGPGRTGQVAYDGEPFIWTGIAWCGGAGEVLIETNFGPAKVVTPGQVLHVRLGEITAHPARTSPGMLR